ncbi:COG4315 family predicted lipoprotein [Kitasatospora cathayae]|uniref:hypothetical protein n=1 Tax=Kitasatospora cathayae TaxID=3004092 RepID=UPI00386011CB
MLALAATACGPDTAAVSGGKAQATGDSSGVRIATVKSVTLGPSVTDSADRTVYKDTAKPSVGTCADACAGKWPPLTYRQPSTTTRTLWCSTTSSRAAGRPAQDRGHPQGPRQGSADLRRGSGCDNLTRPVATVPGGPVA